MLFSENTIRCCASSACNWPLAPKLCRLGNRTNHQNPLIGCAVRLTLDRFSFFC